MKDHAEGKDLLVEDIPSGKKEINASGLLVIFEKQHPLTISQFHLQQNKQNGPEEN